MPSALSSFSLSKHSKHSRLGCERPFHSYCINCLTKLVVIKTVKHYAPNCMLVPVCMTHLFHLNEVKFKFSEEAVRLPLF